ncbi:MBL fold metallo-hydrolase [Vibrio sp. JPW-9-11-11]|uniref:MBL fold metallo-hydrolase n=1 Tax=Vibrio sp. JPW-9-11-11 TaxID=1416532 RepID=UPI001593AE50|nr:MBL fold metallo-hydrolase [Vibrio sp. JPW-9-11-11]NVD08502.1 MBL fold metallo-hydrolase [Vibrio sp. JPW-9-11-11]
MTMGNVIKASVISVLGMLGYNQCIAHDSNQARQQSERQRAERIAQSPQFKEGKAVTRMPSVTSDESTLEVMRQFFFERSSFKPSHKLPHYPTNLALLNQRSEQMRVTWLGHSSLFIDLDNIRILIDPVFDYASPWVAKSLFKRNLDAPLERGQVPVPDVIVISHDHYDHLEESTVRHFANEDVKFFVPLGVGRHLESWGVDPSKINEFDWWQEASIDGVTFTSTPANHNSGRTGFDSNSTLWCSWAIKGQNGSFFYSGDSAYDDHFSQIGKKLGPFDIAFIEVAANVKNGRGFPVENWGHMQARHTMQAFQDLDAEQLFPVHWSTYELFAYKWDEPITDLIAEAQVAGAHLVTPMVGETLAVTERMKTTFWWKNSPYHLSNVSLSTQELYN